MSYSFTTIIPRASCFSNMVFPTMHQLSASHEDERLTRGLCAAAREGSGGPKAHSSQRAGQLGTSRSSSHPAAQLNLQFCLQWGLKRQHGEHIYQWLQMTLFFWGVVGGNWRVDGLIWLPQSSSSWRPEADSSETRVWWNEKNKGVAPLAWWEWNSPVVLTEWMYKVMDSHTCAAFNSPGNTPISWKIKIRGCWVLKYDVFQSPIFCQMTFPVPKVKEFAWTNPFSLHRTNATDCKFLL